MCPPLLFLQPLLLKIRKCARTLLLVLLPLLFDTLLIFTITDHIFMCIVFRMYMLILYLILQYIIHLSLKKLEDIPVSDQEKEVLPYYCLEAAYIDLLLHDGFGFTESSWPLLNFKSKVRLDLQAMRFNVLLLTMLMY